MFIHCNISPPRFASRWVLQYSISRHDYVVASIISRENIVCYKIFTKKFVVKIEKNLCIITRLSNFAMFTTNFTFRVTKIIHF